MLGHGLPDIIHNVNQQNENKLSTEPPKITKVCFLDHLLKVIHRDISSAYFFLIVDLRERGTLLQQKNGLKKSQAQKI